jgi:hypothetical protein
LLVAFRALTELGQGLHAWVVDAGDWFVVH